MQYSQERRDQSSHIANVRCSLSALVRPVDIPSEYVREKLSAAPDKVAIKAALARGLDIPGVRLTQKVSLVRK
jgi:hypothetical protein